MNEKITVAIPYYNRSNIINETLNNILDDDRVSEIIINDDCSSDDDFSKLNDYIKSLNNSKIKIYRNAKNLGSFYNKLETMKKCTNEWVYLLDSDNYLYEDSLDSLYILDWDRKVAYYPSGLFANGNSEPYNRCHGNWAHDRYCGDKEFDFDDAANMLRTIPGFEGLLNAGNCFINSIQYIETCNKYLTEIEEPNFNSFASDGIFFNYLWLIDDGKMKVVSGLNYFHRIHGGSSWSNSANESNNVSARLKNLFENNIKDIKKL